MSELFEKLQPYLDQAIAFQSAMSLFEWDNETIAPEHSAANTSKVMGIISNEYMNSLINDNVRQILKEFKDDKEDEKLTNKEKAIVKELYKIYEQLESIPPKEYRAYNELVSQANRKWAKAKDENNYSEFAPVLKEIIDYKKKFAGYRAKDGKKPYEVLLGDFDECFGTKELDIFFEKVKEELIPLLKEVSKKASSIDKDYNYLLYDTEKQKEFCINLSVYLGFDFNKGVMAESAHPFTLQLHNKDVRITNKYIENNLESAIFSVIHETGHALYEFNVDDELTQTLLGGGASMGMHESQSRFFENNIGRSKEFWTPLFDKLLQTYPEQLKDVTLDHFIKGINKSEPSLIRIEADELSYPLHIIIRYEVEKMIFDGEVTVEELPEVWNKKYEEYLGLTPPDYASGVLQDTHWSIGEFGYFPSYAIGSAIAAQIYYHLLKTFPLNDYLREGNITPVIEFLKDKIHKYGMTKNTNEILKDMTGEEFNADYYVQYLKEKYETLYNISI